MMDLVVPDNWIATSSHLYSCQSIAVNVIVLNQTTTFAEYVYAALMTIVNLVFPVQHTTVLKKYGALRKDLAYHLKTVDVTTTAPDNTI